MARAWAWLRVIFGVHELTPTERIRTMEDNVKAWWKDALERLVWTAVQGGLAVLTAQQLGWVDLGDGELWKAAAAGGIGASLSFLKSMAATRLSAGDTAQLGARTYSYTATGPGSAGDDVGAVNVMQALLLVLVVLAIIALVIWIF